MKFILTDDDYFIPVSQIKRVEEGGYGNWKLRTIDDTTHAFDHRAAAVVLAEIHPIDHDLDLVEFIVSGDETELINYGRATNMAKCPFLGVDSVYFNMQMSLTQIIDNLNDRGCMNAEVFYRKGDCFYQIDWPDDGWVTEEAAAELAIRNIKHRNAKFKAGAA
ncbi:MAG: hypothetical protein ABJN62_11350 [Halioglobus sp.]